MCVVTQSSRRHTIQTCLRGNVWRSKLTYQRLEYRCMIKTIDYSYILSRLIRFKLTHIGLVYFHSLEGDIVGP